MLHQPEARSSMDPWLLLEENCPVDLTDQRLWYKQLQVTGPAGVRRIYLQYKLHYSTVSLHLPGRWEYWDSRRLSNGVLSLLKCNDAMILMECWSPLIHCFLHPSANSILSDAVSFPGWGNQDLQWGQTAEARRTTILQTAEARSTTILQPVEKKPHSQKDRQDEKAEGYVPDEGTR